MRRRSDPTRSTKSSGHGAASARGLTRLRALVRESHIFASAVREVLDGALLREVDAASLTAPQFHLLKLLARNGLHQVGEAAGFLGVSPPAACRNIDKLERLGLLVRRPSRDDRRAVLLAVSRRGRELVERYERLMTARFGSVLRQFEPAEVAALTGLLERLSIALFRLRPPTGDICLRCAAYIADPCPVSQVLGGCTYQTLRKGRMNGRRKAGPAD